MSDCAPKSREAIDPFHEVADGQRPPGPAILLISFHFPPSPAAGSLRWQKFLSLANRSWHFDVVTLDPACLRRLDEERLSGIPPGTRIFGVGERAPIIERFENWAMKVVGPLVRFSKTLKWIGKRGKRGEPLAEDGQDNHAVLMSLSPAEQRFSLLRPVTLKRAYHAWLSILREKKWSRRAAKLGLRLAGSRAYSAVITSGPPHLVHEAGRIICGDTGAAFVMDLRDPWSFSRRLPEATASPIFYILSKRYELRCVSAADLIVVNTDNVKGAMIEKYPKIAPRILTVTNGYDERVPKNSSSCFFVTYAGAIYLDRDPRALFDAAATVIKDLQLREDQFRLELVGQVASYNGISTRHLAQLAGISSHVDIVPPESQEALRRRLSRSSVLVSLPQDSLYAVPSKVFEYMQYEAWIMVYGKPGTAIWETLSDSAVKLVSAGDINASAELLKKFYLEFKEGRNPPKVVEKRFSRQYQAEKFFQEISRVMSKSNGPRDRSGAEMGA